MANDLDDLADPERRLCEVLAAYFEAARAGQAPEREAWLAQYPDLADQLVAFLDEQDRLLRMTEPLRTIVEETGCPDTDAGWPSANGHGTALLDARAPVRIFGDYELLGEIARGGMGVVYRARQRSLNRPVALKMLPGGSLADQDDVRRFRLEAEAVAQLDHPNIVPIHEVGEHDGISYFAMKLIGGGSLARRPPGPVTDTRAAARLLAAVARAVHHAHQRGVLHRDLKPSNILIDAEGQPHITDFGLAKRVGGDSELTQSGAILGTPSYMAPEQASGQGKAVTTATDVYGLGAVLYALLTGKPPFRGDSVLETLERVQHEPPEPPSGVGRRIDRDLETICLKCLEKEPGRRYESALTVAEDLERWLRGESIAARPVGRVSRAWRWCRRNRGIASLLALVALLASAGIIGLAASNVLIARERDEARRQRQQARRAVDTMYTQIAEKWLAEYPYFEPVQRAFLAEAAEFYRSFTGEDGTDPVMRGEIARASYRLGLIDLKLGRLDKAEPALRHAIALQTALAAEFPRAREFREALATSLDALGRILENTGPRPQAEVLYLQAIALWEGLLADQPRELGLLRGLGTSYNSLAGFYTDAGFIDVDPTAYEKAWDPLRRCLEIREPLSTAGSATKEDRQDLARIYHNLGRQSLLTGRLAQAETYYRQALAIKRPVAARYPHAPRYRLDLANTLEGLGETIWLRGRFQEAEELLLEAVQHNQRLADESPDVLGYRHRLADSLDSLARSLATLGRDPEAVDARRRIVAIFRSLRNDHPASDYESHMVLQQRRLAMLLANCAEPRVRNPREALQLTEGAVEAKPGDGANWNALGLAEYRSSDWDAAIRALERSVELRAGGDASDWLFLAMAHWQRGEKDKARHWYDKAETWLKQNAGDDKRISWLARDKPNEWDLRRYRAEAAALLGVGGPSNAQVKDQEAPPKR
jgi:tetratricopeptide (TPR) repeat protein